MPVVYVSWSEARSLVLTRLRQLAEKMGPVERTLKVVWDYGVYSLDELIREVTLNTEIGQKVVVMELRKIGEETGNQYVIRG